MSEGMRFAIREGQSTIGAGVINKIYTDYTPPKDAQPIAKRKLEQQKGAASGAPPKA
jgi:hypothetical protein